MPYELSISYFHSFIAAYIQKLTESESRVDADSREDVAYLVHVKSYVRILIIVKL